MSEIELTIVPYTVSADRLAQFGADFDSEAIDDAVLEQLNRLVPHGIVVHRNGRAFASDEAAARVGRDIHWGKLLETIDLNQIVADHAK